MLETPSNQPGAGEAGFDLPFGGLHYEIALLAKAKGRISHLTLKTRFLTLKKEGVPLGNALLSFGCQLVWQDDGREEGSRPEDPCDEEGPDGIGGLG